MSDVAYLDTSAVLRAILERGLSPDLETRFAEARFLITSRLALIESERVLLRLRAQGRPEAIVADAAREAESVWARCTIWELTREVCDLAAQVAPLKPLRTLDALHVATFVLARRAFGEDVALLTADARLREAVGGL